MLGMHNRGDASTWKAARRIDQKGTGKKKKEGGRKALVKEEPVRIYGACRRVVYFSPSKSRRVNEIFKAARASVGLRFLDADALEGGIDMPTVKRRAYFRIADARYRETARFVG